MALSETLHDTANALLDYAESAGLITEAHGGKKIATHKWRCAVADLYSPTGCLRAFEPHVSELDRNYSKLKVNLVRLMNTLHKNYCKKKFEGIFVLAIEEKGHRLWNDWKTSSALYDRQMALQKAGLYKDQTHIAEQRRAANQELGLCHGAIQSPSLPILSPPATKPAIARSIQTSITPFQSSTRSQLVHPLWNRQDPYSSTNTNLNHVNGHQTDLQPRVHFPVDERTATRNCVYSNRNTSSIEDDDDTIIMDEIIDERIATIGRRPELQIANPRPYNRQRIERECERPQPINSILQFPVDGTQLCSAHTEIDDQRTRSQIETLDNIKKDPAREICNMLASLRQELRTTCPPINVTPTRGTLATTAPNYVDQTQALVNQTQAIVNLANALNIGQDFMTEHSRNHARGIINSILDCIENGMMINRNEIEI